MPLTRKRLAVALAALLAVSGGVAAQEDPLLGEAARLLDAGQAGQAYALLAAEAEARAGDPAFDLMLGTAAIDGGDPTEAVFALERVLDQQPDNAAARAQIARAYLKIGERDAAKREFEQVSRQPVPPAAQQTISRYLTQIEYELAADRTAFYPYVQFGAGYDSNVNSATDSRQIAVPAAGGITFNLADNSRELDSAVWDLGAGFTFASPLADDVRLFGGINFDNTITGHETDFNHKTADGMLGVHWLRGAEQFRLAVEGQKFYIDGTSNFDADREFAGLTGQWQHTVDERNQFTLFAQAAVVRYPEQDVRNVNRYVGGAGWGHAFGGDAAPVVFLSLFGGTEDAQSDRSGAHFGNDFIAVRAGGQYNLRPDLQGFGSFTYQHSEYDEPDPAFGVTRDEDFVDMGVGIRYTWRGNWTVTPELRYTNNDSTLEINEYDRVQALVTIRNDF